MSTTARRRHWETVYAGRGPEAFSWYQDDPRLSLAMIQDTVSDLDAAILDVGGGASRLVDHLLARGYRDLSVLDISGTAIEAAKRRLGDAAGDVVWLEVDVTRFVPQRRYDIWHDRAAFHFLTEEEDRRRYVEVLDRALAPEGQAVIATFGPDGPTTCSGLEVRRYDAAAIQAALGPGFALVEERASWHLTPAGAEQAFRFFRLRRAGV